ncbi:MAG: carboxymuconolactone decarboxylase family protein [Betaproteobacteria bacterium]|jgi:4-carboxymuconolactone decarboxylase|nr:carboxymuconolactone decarboxylase family protein [Betaproteobacteria bacterium]
MARVPYVKYEEMDDAGREIYDRIRTDRKAKEVGFQFRAMLHSPQAAAYLTSMGAELRFRSAIPDNLKELAILVVAREWNSDIEWTAHAPLAEKAGVSPTTIEAIRAGKPLNGLTDEEQVVVRFVQRLLRDKNLPDETFGAAQQLLGTRGVVDLTLTCSYYAAINMAQVALKPGMEAGKASTL